MEAGWGAPCTPELQYWAAELGAGGLAFHLTPTWASLEGVHSVSHVDVAEGRGFLHVLLLWSLPCCLPRRTAEASTATCKPAKPRLRAGDLGTHLACSSHHLVSFSLTTAPVQ